MMAAAAVSAPQTATEDDEAWLYGDDNKESQGKGSGASEPQKRGKKDDREAGELSGEEESQGKENTAEKESEDDDDDSDDDVQVTIGDIQTFPMNDASRNLFKTQGGYQRGAGASGASRGTTSTGTTKGVDVDAVGTINGVPTYDFDLDGLQADDKPWRKPGADITDYFNYGFNEDTWRLYCDRQRRMRNESGTSNRVYSTIRTTGDPKKDMLGDSVRSVPVLENRKPVTNRKTGGTIDVIGSTARDSRRPDAGDPIPTTGKTYATTQASIPGLPPGIPPPDYSVPPPGLPPPGFPPPGVPLTSVPPPGAIPPGYEHFYPPPTTRFDERGSNYYDSQNYSSSFTDSHATWDNRSSGYRWDGGRDRSPARSESDFSSSGSERDYRYRERRDYRDRDRDRDRSPYRKDRDRYRDRDRDRDRDRNRDRDRERDRDRDRDRYRERDSSRTREGSRDIRIKEEKDKDRDRHKSSRRKKDDEESDNHKSKHKKKKIKKEKDDDDQYPPALSQETPVKSEPM